MAYDMAIHPGTEASFRLVDIAAKPMESNISHQVKIQDAHVVSEYY